MNVKFSTIVEDYFTKDKYPEMNAKLSSNFFALDAIGIPIRQDSEGKKTVFGWYRIDNKFYHHTVDQSLIGKVSDEELKRLTLIALKKKHKGVASSRSQMKRYLDIYEKK